MNVSPDDMAESAADAARLLRLMSHDGRLMVLCHLSQGERTVGELQAKLGLSQSALSQHLARLRAERLVTAEREGTRMIYRLSSPAARRVVEVLHGIYCAR
jgi:DNA-binding transcriptional ArsR family regulator